jgi:uncharacterized membrane protein YoaT (DUF817 family)
MSSPRHTRFEAVRLRLEAFDPGTDWRLVVYEFLLIGFGLVALFIWFAENIAAFADAWNYPEQEQEWRMVSIAKYASWYLLMLFSFVLVTLVQPAQETGGGQP